MGSYTVGHNASRPQTNIQKNNHEEPKRSAALGRLALKLLRGGGGGLPLVCGRPTLALSSALVLQTLSCSVCVEDS